MYVFCTCTQRACQREHCKRKRRVLFSPCAYISAGSNGLKQNKRRRNHGYEMCGCNAEHAVVKRSCVPYPEKLPISGKLHWGNTARKVQEQKAVVPCSWEQPRRRRSHCRALCAPALSDFDIIKKCVKVYWPQHHVSEKCRRSTNFGRNQRSIPHQNEVQNHQDDE